MGNKTSAIGVRLSITNNWEDSVYFRSKDYSEYLNMSYKLKTYLINCYKQHGLIKVNIKQERYFYKVVLEVEDSRYFLQVIKGRINSLNAMLKKLFWSDIKIVVKQIDNPICHPLVIAYKLINETSDIALKTNVKQIANSLIGVSIVGLKVRYAGRINGSDIAQTIWHIEGRVPLQTLTADIRYASVSIKTNYGICTIKVWVCMKDS
ncbi:30S ribosomal protein S3 [Candidatus Hodgkinia cicadicola]|uniref:30S ribosomal protein S3 n=1 Tax=Candidatus Hodgkinia cicadicola TaxID=573658 RepID=A0ABX4MGB9_9HYPH|nr:30S ribosomal protein S3 [Candidatus Hodgkinia cicadicola]